MGTEPARLDSQDSIKFWKVYFSDFTGGIRTDLRILPVDLPVEYRVKPLSTYGALWEHSF